LRLSGRETSEGFAAGTPATRVEVPVTAPLQPAQLVRIAPASAATKAPEAATTSQGQVVSPSVAGSAQAAESSAGFMGSRSAEAVANARRAGSRSGHSSEFPVFEIAVGGLGLLMYIMGSQLMGFKRSSARPVRVRR
jgi:hypothetical protein